MRTTPSRLAFIVFAQLIFIGSGIGSAGAQIKAPIPAQALDGQVPNADAAVGIALAFLSTYSPTAENVVREQPSWKAVSVGDTWVVREKAPKKTGAFVIVVSKADGRILRVEDGQ